jgi:hypothetical protein
MKLFIKNFHFWIISIACLFSGLTLSANTGSGFILAAYPLIILLVIINLFSNERYRIQWLIGTIGFLILSIINGSRLGSVVLVVLNLFLIESIRQNNTINYISIIDLKWALRMVLIFMLLAIIDLLSKNLLGLWVFYSTGEREVFDFPRLKLFFSEPSYLGMFCVAVLYKLKMNSNLFRLIAAIAIATHSLVALIYFLVLYYRKKIIWLNLLFLSGVVLAFYLARTDVDLFFTSSGLVRLVGITELIKIRGFQLLIGQGLGSGDVELQSLFIDYGIEYASGFVFSLIYDVGILGMFFLYLAYSRNIFDFFHLNFLLLNLGIGSFLLPILMCINTNKKIPDNNIDSKLNYIRK